MSARSESLAEAIAAERALAIDLVQYVGQWVAVKDHRVVAHEDTLAALLASVADRKVDGLFQVSEGASFFPLASLAAAGAA